MGKIVVGRWDCSYCGTKGIRGSERECLIAADQEVKM